MQIKSRFTTSALVVAGALAMTACAGGPYGMGGSTQPVGGSAYPAGQAAYSQYGRVTNVEMVRGGTGGTGGIAGAAVGGAVGGLAGNQVGSGRGRTAATVAGVAAGALIGYTVEQQMATQSGRDYYRVTVQFDNGGSQTFNYADQPNVRIGDRVRAEGNQLYR